MSTLTDHTLIYDSECPMCSQYSKVFVQAGMLDKNGREAYVDMPRDVMPHVDWTRARNEIALVNHKDHSVRYGLDSLLTVVENSHPIFKKLFRFPPVFVLLRHFYFFISYNRKAITPARVFEGNQSCTPTMNYAYRIAYLVFAWLITSIVLVRYFELGVPVVPASGYVREFMVCAGQLLFQGVIVAFFRSDRVIHYLGNVMTVSLAGAIALSPMFILTHWIQSPWFYIVYFMMVVAFMFFEHKRRVRILELPVVVSYSWVLYRFLILFTVIY